MISPLDPLFVAAPAVGGVSAPANAFFTRSSRSLNADLSPPDDCLTSAVVVVTGDATAVGATPAELLLSSDEGGWSGERETDRQTVTVTETGTERNRERER